MHRVFHGEALEGACIGRNKEVVKKTIAGILERAAGDESSSIVGRKSYQEAKENRTPGSVLSLYLDWENMLQPLAASQSESESKLLQVTGIDRLHLGPKRIWCWAKGNTGPSKYKCRLGRVA